MPRDGAPTRERILEVAHDLALRRGFAATSLDRVIEAAGITKGGFFYHFGSRSELAHAMVQRYALEEQEIVAELLAKAERLSRDPLQQTLIFVGLFEDLMRETEHPGCLFATFVNELEITDRETARLVHDALLGSRHMMIAKLEQVLEVHDPRIEVDVVALADMYTAIFEGAFLLARTFDDPSIVATQLAQYRSHLELLFSQD